MPLKDELICWTGILALIAIVPAQIYFSYGEKQNCVETRDKPGISPNKPLKGGTNND